MGFKVNRGYRWDSTKYECAWVDDQDSPEIVVCLRLSDAPTCFVPIDGCISHCTSCGEAVVYNPAGPLARVEKVCLNCMRKSRLDEQLSLDPNEWQWGVPK